MGFVIIPLQSLVVSIFMYLMHIVYLTLNFLLLFNFGIILAAYYWGY